MNNQDVVDCKWKFKAKLKKSATAEKYKAHLEAKGIQQMVCVDFNKTFSTKAKLSSIRLLFVHAHTRNFYVPQCDVKNTFRNGCLDKKIFMRKPDGVFSRQPSQDVRKLNHTQYGLNQTARGFYEVLSKALRRCPLTTLCTDPTVFFETIDECDIFVVAYVDDLFIICKKKDTATIVKNKLRKPFVLIVLGRASEFVGVAIYYDHKEDTKTLSQVDAIGRCLKKFNKA